MNKHLLNIFIPAMITDLPASFVISEWFGHFEFIKSLIDPYVLCWCLSLFRSHSDLALRNCYLTTDLTVKVGDYGIGPYRYKVSINLNFRYFLHRDFHFIIIVWNWIFQGRQGIHAGWGSENICLFCLISYLFFPDRNIFRPLINQYLFVINIVQNLEEPN